MKPFMDQFKKLQKQDKKLRSDIQKNNDLIKEMEEKIDNNPIGSGSDFEEGSLEESARNNFVKKVYSIISLQLAFTVSMVTLTMYSRAFARFQQRNMWTFWVALIGSIVTILALCINSII